MGLFEDLTVYHIVGFALAVLISKKAIDYVNRRIIEKRFIAKYNCEDPKEFYGEHWYDFLFFGVTLAYSQIKHLKEGNLLRVNQKLFKERGGNFVAHLMGSRYVGTIEPQNIQAILAKKFEDFDLGNERYRAFKPLLGNGVFTLDGHGWSNSRALLRPNFTKMQVSDLEPVEVHTSNLLKLIPTDGSAFDIQPLFFKFTMDNSTEFLFGESAHSLLHDKEEDEKWDFATAFSYAQEIVTSRVRMGPLYWVLGGKDFKESCNYIHRYAERYVDLSLRASKNPDIIQKKTTDRYVFLEAIGKETQDRTALRDQLLNVLLAGRDTTASLLSLTFYELARHPDVYQKLRDEIMEVCGDRHPTYENIKDMAYLRYVVTEVLRLYPIVPMNLRTANKNTFLPVGGGKNGDKRIFIRKGDTVLYQIHATQRDPTWFGADAEEFRPERWKTLRCTSFEYLPFNGGNRICLGQNMALTDASYVISRILQNFSGIENKDSRPWKEGLNLTLSSGNGTHISLKKDTRYEKTI